MAIGSVYRLSVVGDAGNQTIVNTFHFLQTDEFPGGLTPPAEIIRRWLGNAAEAPVNAYARCLPNLYVGRELNCINVANPLDNSLEQNNQRGLRGSTEICPPQCCGLLSLETQGRGRSYRGRTYIGPVLELDQSAGTITSGYSNVLTALVNSLVFNYGSTPFAWVVYSRKLKQSFPVLRVHVRLYIATQRRRSAYNPG